MAALPNILVMVVPLGLLLYLRQRLRSPRWQRAVSIGLVAVWLYSAYEAIALSLFLVFTPAGIGQDDWLELWVSLGVAAALSGWLILDAATRTGRRGS